MAEKKEKEDSKNIKQKKNLKMTKLYNFGCRRG